MVRAGLKRDIGCCTFDAVALCRCITQSHDFGVRTACWLGVALAYDDASFIDNDATYGGVGIAYSDRN